MILGEKKPGDSQRRGSCDVLGPHLIAWYQGDQTRIDSQALDQYLEELALLTFAKNWAYTVCEENVTTHQCERQFIDWEDRDGKSQCHSHYPG